MDQAVAGAEDVVGVFQSVECLEDERHGLAGRQWAVSFDEVVKATAVAELQGEKEGAL